MSKDALTHSERGAQEYGALEQIFAWARASSLTALPVRGSFCSRTMDSWLQANLPAELSMLALGGSPKQADLLVVLGEVSHKLAPHLQRMHARMADPCFVLHIRNLAVTSTSYALVSRLEDILPVDVVIAGNPPASEETEAGLLQLRKKIQEKRSGR